MATMQHPKTYSDSELEALSRRMVAEFVRNRHDAEARLAERYHLAFAEAKASAVEVFEKTGDLKNLFTAGQELLAGGYLQTLRNMSRPTVSEDDFKKLSSTGTASARKFEDSELSAVALNYLGRNLNQDLFPWLKGSAEPTDFEREAAVVAVAALVADQKTKTAMRGISSKQQELAVRQKLIDGCGMVVVDGDKSFDYLKDGPKPGQVFARETKVAGTKADIVLGLFDGRIMCLECKVSNTEVNSYKRLNHEAVDKIKKWSAAFGMQCVSGVVLQGCFKAENLAAAQREDAYLFWSSELSALVDFVNATKQLD